MKNLDNIYSQKAAEAKLAELKIAFNSSPFIHEGGKTFYAFLSGENIIAKYFIRESRLEIYDIVVPEKKNRKYVKPLATAIVLIAGYAAIQHSMWTFIPPELISFNIPMPPMSVIGIFSGELG